MTRLAWLRAAVAMAAVVGMTSIQFAAAAEELELHHPDFHARLGMKVYVVIGDAPAGASLALDLTCDNTTKLAYTKGQPAKEEAVTLNFRDLPKGKYTLRVVVLDSSRKVLKQATREWEKPYDGLPRVGIDENNSLIVGGKPFFAVTTWGIGDNEREIDPWAPYVNTLSGYTFSKENATVEGWKKVLDAAGKRGLMVMGPDYGNYWPNGDCRRFYKRDGNSLKDREAKLDAMEEYVKQTREHPALLLWAWLDEPELDTPRDCVPPSEVRKWTEMAHRADPQHPVFLNTGGGGFARAPENWLHKHLRRYTYLHSDLAGPRVLMADVISQDIYPRFGEDLAKVKAAQQATTRAGKPVPELPTLENLCLAMDRMRDYNRDLAPFWANVKTAGDQGKATLPPVKALEIRACFWASVIHGAKGMSWFHYFGPTPAENLAEMKRLLEQVTRLTPAICGADYRGAASVKAASASAAGRVDILCKEAEGVVYLLAANIKESADKATFTLDFVPKKIEVVDEKRELTPDGKTFADDFEPIGVHIYRIEK